MALQDTGPNSSSSELARSFIEENRTFDRQQAASAWLEKREKELAKPSALERLEAPDPTLSIVIDRYTDESIKKIGR
jgi:hypothetical protein